MAKIKAIIEKIKFSKEIKILFIPYLILVAIHLLLAQKIESPWLVPDEFIHLAHARYFAGLPHAIFLQEPYAHFAYGFFIAPSFFLFQNLENAYRFIVLLNSLYISSLYIILFLILTKIFRQDKRSSLYIAFLVNFLSGVFIRTYSAVSENLFIPLFHLVLLLFYLFLEKVNYWRAFFFALAVGLLYATHYRGLVVVGCSIVYLLLLYFYRKNKALLFGAFLILFNAILINLFNGYLIQNFWIDAIKYSALQSLLDLIKLDNFLLFFSSILGQLIYLVIASAGLVVWAWLYLIKKINIFLFLRHSKTSKDHFILFAGIVILAIFFSSTLVTVVASRIGDFRFDHFFYGRYNEVFLPLLIAIGLIKWSNISKFKMILFTTLYFSIYIFVYFFIGRYLNHYNYGIINIISFAPIMLTKLPWSSLLFLVFFTPIIFLVFFRLRDINKKIILLAIILLFNPGLYYAPSINSSLSNSLFFQKIINPIRANNIDSVAYKLVKITESERGKYDDNYTYWHGSYFALQYYLPQVNITPINDINSFIEFDAVITSCSWQDEKYNQIQHIFINESDPLGFFSCMALYFKK